MIILLKKIIRLKILLLLTLPLYNLKSEVIIGTFNYMDVNPYNNKDNYLNPIRFANVEIWSISPGGTWQVENRTTTDNSGSINIKMQFKKSNVTYGLRIFAQNYACNVLDMRTPYPAYIFWTPPLKNGKEIKKKVKNPKDVLDFSCDFSDDIICRSFNVAEIILIGFDYASNNRDPNEIDEITPVRISPGSIVSVSYYNFIDQAIQLMPKDFYSDYLILHEYAHHIENCIGTFASIVSYHDGCKAHGWDGQRIFELKADELAWMEGFADFFSQAVVRKTNNKIFYGGNGTLSLSDIETPYCADVISDQSAFGTEKFVASILWDLVDSNSINILGSEKYDDFQDLDEFILQILDDELDVGKWPTFANFIDAWNTRGLRSLDKLICQNKLSLFFNEFKITIYPKYTFYFINNSQVEVQIDVVDECQYNVFADIYDTNGNLLSSSGKKFIVNVNCQIEKRKKKKTVMIKPSLIVDVPCEIIKCNNNILRFIIKKNGYQDINCAFSISKNSCN